MLLGIAVALSGVPDGIRAAAAPADAVSRFTRVHPERARLACAPLLPEHALLCFRVWEEGKRRWVTEADLARWEVDVAGLVEHLATAGRERLTTEPQARRVVDMPAEYRVYSDADGWAVLPLLHGELLAGRMGEKVRVAMPRTAVFLAWPAGDEALDTVMAVAVREMYDAADDAVSPMVHVYKAGRFVPFGQANPKGG